MSRRKALNLDEARDGGTTTRAETHPPSIELTTAGPILREET
jgi:hypothetical protein